jgi:hypothetical protein
MTPDALRHRYDREFFDALDEGVVRSAAVS